MHAKGPRAASLMACCTLTDEADMHARRGEPVWQPAIEYGKLMTTDEAHKHMRRVCGSQLKIDGAQTSSGSLASMTSRSRARER